MPGAYPSSWIRTSVGPAGSSFVWKRPRLSVMSAVGNSLDANGGVLQRLADLAVDDAAAERRLARRVDGARDSRERQASDQGSDRRARSAPGVVLGASSRVHATASQRLMARRYRSC